MPHSSEKGKQRANIRDTDWMDNLHNEMINKQTFILQFLVNDYYKI